ncbi:molecular chaperone HtpG [Metaclostridioides mangenotii]|uniref:molecular chaperone HtpG n=1 Tax=Metaclostridioides mangenotii TaxID=1540 RepID=UPI0028ECA854|nr:molecular chaperone HtpG [Clostridioides mangenotii]
MSIEKGSISIHTENIFPIIKKWLYSDKDIFIRELISNGCDAVNKYKRLKSLGEIPNSGEEAYKITVSVNNSEGTIKFTDNGIGMTAEEVKKYINQVAFSGAEDFFNKYKDKMEEPNDIIGHFGLGFYSSFMVSDKVQIDTMSFVESSKPVRWVSKGGTEYEITESDFQNSRGTTITLYLSEDSKEFLDYYTVKYIITKYCSFLPVEIFLVDEVKVKEEKLNVEKTKEEDVIEENIQAEVKEDKQQPLNDISPLWLKAPKDCTDEEYIAFYKKVFNALDEPLFWMHLNVDYPFNLKGILYFPKLKNEFEIREGEVKLFNNQVFVADNIKEIIPEFLLLLKGVIDCPDLPLNVSRSFLQNDREVGKISKHIVKKVADKLKSLFKNEREEYEKFWDDIHLFIKYGCLKDESFYEKVKDCIMYKTIDKKHITLKEYLEENKEKHENKVFYVSNEEQQFQYIKMFKDYDINAVVLDSTIDVNFISFIEFKENGVKFSRIDSDLNDVLNTGDGKDTTDTKVGSDKSKSAIEDIFKDSVGGRIKNCKVESLKGKETPAIILISEDSIRMSEMKSNFAGVDFGVNIEEEKTLVINANNSIVNKIVDLENSDKEDKYKKETIDLLCNQIVDLALMSNKELDPSEMNEFIKRNLKLMNLIISI